MKKSDPISMIGEQVYQRQISSLHHLVSGQTKYVSDCWRHYVDFVSNISELGWGPFSMGYGQWFAKIPGEEEQAQTPKKETDEPKSAAKPVKLAVVAEKKPAPKVAARKSAPVKKEPAPKPPLTKASSAKPAPAKKRTPAPKKPVPAPPSSASSTPPKK